jgi:hypothetical protein
VIDPDTCTAYTLNKHQLEEFALFSILVAGKTARVIARSLDSLLTEAHDKLGLEGFRPFASLAVYSVEDLQAMLKRYGVGCHSLKAQAIYDVIRRNFDLQTVESEDLERVFGVGPKTARFFILHTRKDARVACLDTHILKFLCDLGYSVPEGTPGSRKQYGRIEKLFIALADKAGMSIAALDLTIWKAYSKKVEEQKKVLLDKIKPFVSKVKYA